MGQVKDLFEALREAQTIACEIEEANRLIDGLDSLTEQLRAVERELRSISSQS